MRAEAVLTLTGSAAVARRTAPLPDGRGGTAATVTTVTTVSCLLQPVAVNAQAAEGAEGQQLAATTRWRALLPYGTGVGPGDQLIIAGVTYDVLDDNEARGIPIYDDVLVVRTG